MLREIYRQLFGSSKKKKGKGQIIRYYGEPIYYRHKNKKLEKYSKKRRGQ